jgi:hypothetical protein
MLEIVGACQATAMTLSGSVKSIIRVLAFRRIINDLFHVRVNVIFSVTVSVAVHRTHPSRIQNSYEGQTVPVAVHSE